MSDVAFRCLYVPDSFASRAQRQAVLYPLVPPMKEARGIENATNHLVEIWRARLSTMKDEGWLPRGDKKALQLVRNCRPSFYQAAPATWFCRLAVCPFCYARRVGEVWQLVQHVFHQEDYDPKWYREDHGNELSTVDSPACCRLKLVERYISYRTPMFVPDVDTGERLRRILKGIASIRGKALRETRAAGGWQHSTVEASRGEWRVRTRQLLVYREHDAIPEMMRVPQRGRKMKIHDLPSRSVLLGVVSRACRYPTLWLRGDPKLTALLFQVLGESRAKLSATFGAFRGTLL
jgi:hypothetical protein